MTRRKWGATKAKAGKSGDRSTGYFEIKGPVMRGDTGVPLKIMYLQNINTNRVGDPTTGPTQVSILC